MDSVQLSPIGHMKTAFTEKFGTPRQSGLVPSAAGILKLNPDPAYALALQQLEGFSHVWVIFLFDRHESWRPLIHPPRVMKSRKVGVFSSRSPHRPNPIGISAVKLEKIDLEAKGGIELHFSGVDLLDGTPVLDIKPYLPYTDSIPEAQAGWASEEIDTFPVEFSEASLASLQAEQPELQKLIEEMLSLDPRPISQKRAMPLRDPSNDGRVFKFRVSIFDVEWQIRSGTIHVLQLHRL